MAQDRTTSIGNGQSSEESATGDGSPRAETLVMQLGENGHSSGEVSAGTIARMMGLVTTTEIKLVEGKVDLLTAKLSTLQAKIEKAISMLGNSATGADLERIDVQVGALRQMIREILTTHETEKQNTTNSEAVKKPGSRIQSNS